MKFGRIVKSVVVNEELSMGAWYGVVLESGQHSLVQPFGKHMCNYKRVPQDHLFELADVEQYIVGAAYRQNYIETLKGNLYHPLQLDDIIVQTELFNCENSTDASLVTKYITDTDGLISDRLDTYNNINLKNCNLLAKLGGYNALSIYWPTLFNVKLIPSADIDGLKESILFSGVTNARLYDTQTIPISYYFI